MGSLFGGKRGLHSVTPRLKTVHRTVFTAGTPFQLPAHSNPSLSNSIKKVTPLGGITFWRKERDSLRYPSPKNSPPDCFCSRNFVSAAGSFESPSFQFKKSDPTVWDHFFGGKRGIRTLGAFIGHTRFPVVRLRPAQPSFHNGSCCVHSTRKCLIIISGCSKKVKLFL